MDVLAVLNEHDERVTRRRRSLALALEAVVVAPVDVLRDFGDVALRVNADVALVGHVIAEVQLARNGGHPMRCPPLVLDFVLACLLPRVNFDN